MKKQLITPLILAFGLSTIAQPSFAIIKYDYPGLTKGRITRFLWDAFATWKALSAVTLKKHEVPVSPSTQPLTITFASSSGTQFTVPEHELGALIQLSPSVAGILEDLGFLQDSLFVWGALNDLENGTITLNSVSHPALYLLTQIASGNYEGLSNYILNLSDGEKEKLHEDAHFLDSQALKDLISSRALEDHFRTLHNELLPLILKQAGPQARTRSRLVSQRLREAVDVVRKPIENGGFGCTDTLPIIPGVERPQEMENSVTHGQFTYVANLFFDTVTVINTASQEIVETIQVGVQPLQPLAHGQFIYVANYGSGSVSVIDTTLNQVVATLLVAEQPYTPIAHGRFLYVTNSGSGSVSVIDTTLNQVVATLLVGERPLVPVLHGQFLYVANSGSNTITVIDTTLNQVVRPIQLEDYPNEPVVHGKFLYVRHSLARKFSVISTASNQVIKTIDIGIQPHHPLAHRQFLYVANYGSGSVSVIDTKSNQVIATILVGERPAVPVLHGQFLYVANYGSGSVSVIDTRSNQVVATILVGSNPRRLEIENQMLFVWHENGFSVFDIGGYLPGQC